jgi:hypothetical protein
MTLSSEFVQRLDAELQRLTGDSTNGTQPLGLGTVRFRAQCPGNTELVLERSKSILIQVNRLSRSDWPTYEQWTQSLPSWFLVRCQPEKNSAEAAKWLKTWRELPQEEQDYVRRECPWSVSGWVYWFQPDNRTWYWWDAIKNDQHNMTISVAVYDWPFAWGALSWLLRAAGARSVDSDE